VAMYPCTKYHISLNTL